MRTMTIVLIALATLSVLGRAARAEYVGGSWCAFYAGRGGASNCGFYSFDQCMAALSGKWRLLRAQSVVPRRKRLAQT